MFDKCTFIGGGDYNYAMDASVQMVNGNERAVNDTLVMKSCTFNNLNCVIRATKKFNCVIEGCRFDKVTSIIHNDGIWYNGQTTPHSYNAGLNANIIINGISINKVDYIFRSRKVDDTTTILYNFDNIVINGIIGEANTTVVDFSGGNVNLEYNAPVSPSIKLFSDNSPSSYHCNVKKAGGMDYKSTSSGIKYTFEFKLQPKETICPFKTFKFYNARWVVEDIVDNDIIVSLNYTRKTGVSDGKVIGTIGTYNVTSCNSDFTDGVINSNGSLIISNNSEVEKTVKITINTYSIILPA